MDETRGESAKNCWSPSGPPGKELFIERTGERASAMANTDFDRFYANDGKTLKPPFRSFQLRRDALLIGGHA